MSFIYRRNRSDPKINPWETPHKSCPGSKNDLLKFTLNYLNDRYGLNQRIAFLENPKNSVFFDKDFVINCVKYLLEINEYHTSMKTGFKTSCSFIAYI